MAWFKVDDKLHARSAPLRALGLWAMAGSWVAAYDTRGHITLDAVRALGGRSRDAQALVDAGLWTVTDTGWRFTNWSMQRDDYRPRIPVKVAHAVIERDWPNCQLCGGLIALGEQHFDHVTPYSAGGKETETNLQLAHDLCNIRKGATHG